MKRTIVRSTCLRSVGHDGGSTLEVQFRKSGAVYQYRGPSPRVATNLKKASSIGRHFVKRIRNEYSYRKVSGGKKKRAKKR